MVGDRLNKENKSKESCARFDMNVFKAAVEHVHQGKTGTGSPSKL